MCSWLLTIGNLLDSVRNILDIVVIELKLVLLQFTYNMLYDIRFLGQKCLFVSGDVTISQSENYQYLIYVFYVCILKSSQTYSYTDAKKRLSFTLTFYLNFYFFHTGWWRRKTRWLFTITWRMHEYTRGMTYNNWRLHPRSVICSVTVSGTN
jgi:hypothetical protein